MMMDWKESPERDEEARTSSAEYRSHLLCGASGNRSRTNVDLWPDSDNVQWFTRLLKTGVLHRLSSLWHSSHTQEPRRERAGGRGG